MGFVLFNPFIKVKYINQEPTHIQRSLGARFLKGLIRVRHTCLKCLSSRKGESDNIYRYTRF